ncbi:MAG: hypothetical protein HYX61_01055 [Gammaproteobacteria bacterium]|nr:hypothetical protein [Gammaproteobacteria bacterium]
MRKCISFSLIFPVFILHNSANLNLIPLIVMKGSSLIEVLVALLIFSTAMLGAGFSIIQSLKFTREGLSQTKNSIQEEAIHDNIFK